MKIFGSKCGFSVLLSWITFFSALAGAQQISLTPSPLSFGDVSVGSSKTQTVVIKNITKRRIGIFQASVSGTGYTISGIACPVALPAGQSMSFNVTFTPPYAGADSGLVSLVTQNWWKEHRTEPSTSVLTLSGSGVASGEIAASPASVAFGNVIVGSSQTVPVTVTNTGGVTATISAAAATGTGFTFTGPNLPATLGPAQSTTFNATFSPAAPGSVSGTLTITSNANNPTLAIPLTGVGVTQGQITPNPASLSFGNVAVGSSKTLTETLTNSGGSSLTISAASVSGTGLTLNGLALPLTLTAGQSKTFNVQFAPAAAGDASGNVTITSDGANPTLNIPVSGTGVTAGTLSANPTSLSFDNVQVGSNASLSETLTNTGGSNVTISQANITGAGFSVTGLALPATLTPSQTVTFVVKFAPAAAGVVSGNLAIVSDAPGSPLNIELSATGVTPGQITPNPTSLAFGNVAVGSSRTLTEALTNSGGSSLTISAASVSGTGFTLSGLTLPLTLNAGQSTSFSVQFAPTATGAVSGNVTITSNGSNPTLNIPVTGTGVSAGTLSANPTSLSFGNVTVGGNASLSGTLTNTGGANVTISQANVTGTGFSITGLTLPATLTPSQTVTFTVKFTPTVSGAVSGNLALVSDASNSPLNIALSGTGVTQGQITPNPTSLPFGTVVIGTTKTLSETLTNSGGSSLTISAASVSGTGFSITGLTLPLTLTAGSSTTFDVRFAPLAAGAVSGNLTITSNGSNPTLTIPVSGTGVTPGTLSANPTSLAFGNVQVGTTGSLSETLTNTGGSAVTISQANVAGTGFSITGLSLPTTLNAGQSVTFTARFTPVATGAVSGNLAIISDASNPTLNIAMSGTGTAPGTLSVSPATLNFGNVVVNTSSSLTGSLTAAGAAVTVPSGTSNSSEFVLSGITFPMTIATGQSTSFTVTFTPNAAGAANATLTFISNASNSPTVEALTGNGQAPVQHSVDLSWTASQSQGVVGYNIYRRAPSGSYSKINSSLNTDTSYTDYTVTAGQTYFYVAKGVDNNDMESGPSNEVEATVPNP